MESIKSTSETIVNQILTEIQDFETNEITLSNRVKFLQYETVQTILTHQNHGFLISLIEGQPDDREFYDIITPMVETSVVNCDLDSENIDAYVDNPDHLAQEYFGRAILKNFLRKTNHGIVLNETIYQFIDDGNIVARKVDNDGELYRPILPQNLYVIDQTAKTLEETAVIEKNVINQTQLRAMKNWANIDDVVELCNTGNSVNIPYYEAFYRYGELTKKDFKELLNEVHGQKNTIEKGDEKNYIQVLVVMVRAKKGQKNDKGQETLGVITFVEELKPETINITKKLEVKRYKPFESVRLGKYNGRFWGMGYREIGIPYQNRANELGNQLREIMQVASMQVFWTSDENIAGKNILSAIKKGQILQAKDLQLLNNVFPNLSLYADEWNRNINECQKALKAFEIASGESLPSTTSATAISIQNQQIGKYFNFKRQRFGLFISGVFKRWVIPELLKIDDAEAIELVGDESFFADIVEGYVNGWMLDNYLKLNALAMAKNPNIPTPTQEDFNQIKELKKQEVLSNPKLYVQATKEFFKEVEMYVGIDPTGEAFNKQAKISNLLQLLQYEVNPAIQGNPEALDSINEIRTMLGLTPRKRNPQQPQPPQPMPAPIGNMPMKEQQPNPQGGNGSML